MNTRWLPQVVVSAMLLWALNPNNPYGYYELLRWVCCGVFGYLAFQAFQQKRYGWVLILGIMAGIYNPIVPVHLATKLWSVVNVVTIGISVVAIFADNQRTGFSWMELSAVATILGVTAVIIVPKVTTSIYPDKHQVNSHKKAVINAAVERWYIEKGAWPANNLSDIGTDANYFPDGIPTNPTNGARYMLNATTHRVQDWPVDNAAPAQNPIDAFLEPIPATQAWQANNAAQGLNPPNAVNAAFAPIGSPGAEKPVDATFEPLRSNDYEQTDTANTPMARVAANFLDAVIKGDTQRASACLSPQAMQRIIASGKQFAPPGLGTATFQIGEVRARSRDQAIVQCVLTDTSDGTPRCEEMCCLLRHVENDWRVCGIAYGAGENQPWTLNDFETGQTTGIPRRTIGGTSSSQVNGAPSPNSGVQPEAPAKLSDSSPEQRSYPVTPFSPSIHFAPTIPVESANLYEWEPDSEKSDANRSRF